MRKFAALFVVGVLVCTGCSQQNSKSTTVVATTTILGDISSRLTRCVGGGATTVTLMPPGSDPHDFAPSSEQVATMNKATLVLANGLGLEKGLSKIFDTINKEGGRVLEVGEAADPLALPKDHKDEHESASPSPNSATTPAKKKDEHGHDHGTEDPHFWFDPDRVAKATDHIGDVLAEVTLNKKYVECSRSVSAEMRKLGSELDDKFKDIPQESRQLVTDHEAFNYFAKRFNFKIVGVVIPGGGTDAKPSSKELADLTAVIKEKNVKAIFSNVAGNSKVEQQLAETTGSKIQIVPLFVESLGDAKSEATTYPDMMRTNVRRIADALKGPR